MKHELINLSQLAGYFQAYNSCMMHVASNDNAVHFKFVAAQWEERIDKLLEALPSGSGIDNGVKFLQHVSKPNKLVFRFDYHHMDEHGGYDGWTSHKAIVEPDFIHGFTVKITGRNRNQIKDYLSDVFYHIFSIDESTKLDFGFIQTS